AYLERRYQIVMWDVLSGDFDTSLSPEDCLRNVLDHVEPGSIVVFHDSLKAEPRLRYVLPRVLEYFKERGWRFERIGR
ncbi:MAG TPA: polysaccharide deacetylase family protein, partial [Saprospiraceae bacterium]|nr:polysaccharide deacetylase family protein [Saprospiraceae bacterium]